LAVTKSVTNALIGVLVWQKKARCRCAGADHGLGRSQGSAPQHHRRQSAAHGRGIEFGPSLYSDWLSAFDPSTQLQIRRPLCRRARPAGFERHHRLTFWRTICAMAVLRERVSLQPC